MGSAAKATEDYEGFVMWVMRFSRRAIKKDELTEVNYSDILKAISSSYVDTKIAKLKQEISEESFEEFKCKAWRHIMLDQQESGPEPGPEQLDLITRGQQLLQGSVLEAEMLVAFQKKIASGLSSEKNEKFEMHKKLAREAVKLGVDLKDIVPIINSFSVRDAVRYWRVASLDPGSQGTPQGTPQEIDLESVDIADVLHESTPRDLQFDADDLFSHKPNLRGKFHVHIQTAFGSSSKAKKTRQDVLQQYSCVLSTTLLPKARDPDGSISCFSATETAALDAAIMQMATDVGPNDDEVVRKKIVLHGEKEVDFSGDISSIKHVFFGDDEATEATDEFSCYMIKYIASQGLTEAYQFGESSGLAGDVVANMLDEKHVELNQLVREKKLDAMNAEVTSRARIAGAWWALVGGEGYAVCKHYQELLAQRQATQKINQESIDEMYKKKKQGPGIKSMLCRLLFGRKQVKQFRLVPSWLVFGRKGANALNALHTKSKELEAECTKLQRLSERMQSKLDNGLMRLAAAVSGENSPESKQEKVNQYVIQNGATIDDVSQHVDRLLSQEKLLQKIGDNHYAVSNANLEQLQEAVGTLTQESKAKGGAEGLPVRPAPTSQPIASDRVASSRGNTEQHEVGHDVWVGGGMFSGSGYAATAASNKDDILSKRDKQFSQSPG